MSDAVFDVSATVPEGTTTEQFSAMLQNLLKDRFQLSYHYETRPMQGFELVVAKNGPKLKESQSQAKPETEANDSRQGEAARNWHSLRAAVSILTPGLA